MLCRERRAAARIVVVFALQNFHAKWKLENISGNCWVRQSTSGVCVGAFLGLGMVIEVIRNMFALYMVDIDFNVTNNIHSCAFPVGNVIFNLTIVIILQYYLGQCISSRLIATVAVA